MNKRIYKVSAPSGTYLVNATTKSQAVRKISDQTIAAEVATQKDLVALIQSGTEILQASEATEQAELLS